MLGLLGATVTVALLTVLIAGTTSAEIPIGKGGATLLPLPQSAVVNSEQPLSACFICKNVEQ